MRKPSADFIKTAGAVVLIALVVVGTFVYGSRQRQEQIRRDQASSRQQQEQQAAQSDTSKVVVQDNQPKPAPAPVSNPPTGAGPGQNVGGGNLSTAGATTPNTGPEDYYLVPLGLIALFYALNKTSAAKLRQARRQQG